MGGPLKDVPVEDELIPVGRLSGAWGVGGAVKVFSYTDPPEQIFEYQPWRTDGSPGLLRVLGWRRQGPRLVAEIEQIPTREDAERLAGLNLSVPRSALPRPPDGRYYWRDLIGLEVENREGRPLGRVRELLDAGVHDVLVIDRPGPGVDHLVPFVRGRFVDSVDLKTGRIVVDWQPEWTDAE
ncbi:16S rRNA processing protein RimM [Wenzhouxiangella sp. XN79A]|uniref:ribosome maturation factor RimM n=1 Tax=Wenzhouxiangella sp. XN79A TaxID=2724193 RepID=UPI00144AB2D8|nr:ribosome maturation factor RimM [Wenzhouxiangella sp. XN79A]NKI33791.1 16S rRNA processing protein RimM [Wenzhouxiangella sp. XN79A]